MNKKDRPKEARNKEDRTKEDGKKDMNKEDRVKKNSIKEIVSPFNSLDDTRITGSSALLSESGAGIVGSTIGSGSGPGAGAGIVGSTIGFIFKIVLVIAGIILVVLANGNNEDRYDEYFDGNAFK